LKGGGPSTSTSGFFFGRYHGWQGRSHHRQHCLQALAVEGDVAPNHSFGELGQEDAVSILGNDQNRSGGFTVIPGPGLT
jgi:hypothetical protein